MAKRSPVRAMKPLVVGLAAALLLVGVVGVIVLRGLGPGIGGLGGIGERLEDWIGSQLVGVANSYLVPQLAFKRIRYEAPGTVYLTDVSLTAPDGTRILELAGMTVELAEVPTIGQPIVIQRIDLDRPTIRLIRVVRPDGSTGLRGLSPIAKASPVRDEHVEEGFKLSRVLRLRKINIRDGACSFDEGDGSPPMLIAGLTATLASNPDQSASGWYTLDFDSALGPLAKLAFKGAVSLDSWETKIERFACSGQLGPDAESMLPGELQTLLREHDVRGRLDLTASGGLKLTDPLAGSLSAKLTLESAHFATGDYQFPLDRLEAEATLGSGFATLSSLRAEMLGGAITAHGDVELGATGRPAHLFWSLEQLDLQRLLRAAPDNGEAPKLAGTLQGGGSATGKLSDLPASLGGKGDVHVRDGRLMVLPGVTELATLMRVMSAGMLSKSLNHKADGEFVLGPRGLTFTSSQLITDFLAARGTGDVGFDGSLDLVVNAGPMEKLESMLGGFGDLLGAVTDNLVKYRIRGTVHAPEVTVAPLGVGG